MSSTDSTPTGLLSNEPVLVGHAVLWVFVNVGAFIVGHTHLVTSSQWSSLSTFLVPIISAFVLTVSTTLIRKYVSPAWKSVLKESNKLGVNSAVLTGNAEVADLLSYLNLDSNGDPLPLPSVDKSAEAVAAQPGPVTGQPGAALAAPPTA